jgi:hypothetical protein
MSERRNPSWGTDVSNEGIRGRFRALLKTDEMQTWIRLHEREKGVEIKLDQLSDDEVSQLFSEVMLLKRTRDKSNLT